MKRNGIVYLALMLIAGIIVWPLFVFRDESGRFTIKGFMATIAWIFLGKYLGFFGG